MLHKLDCSAMQLYIIATTSMDSLFLTNVLCFFDCVLMMMMLSHILSYVVVFIHLCKSNQQQLDLAPSGFHLDVRVLHILVQHYLHLLPGVSVSGTHLVTFHCSNVEKSHLKITPSAAVYSIRAPCQMVNQCENYTKTLKIWCKNQKETVDEAIWRLAWHSTFKCHLSQQSSLLFYTFHHRCPLSFSVRFFLLFVICLILLSYNFSTFYWFKVLLQSTFISVFRVVPVSAL